MQTLPSISKDGQAIIIGNSGAIGAAVEKIVRQSGFPLVHCFSRNSGFDLCSEDSIRLAADQVERCDLPVRFLFIATGFLYDRAYMPEKSIHQISQNHLEKSFQINTIGPALVLKYFMPLVAGKGRAVMAVLSAKVGSIADNRLGGWYSYRASKAALNQFIKTSAIELKRKNSDALCVALHPGTVDSKLSEPFQKTGLLVRPPQEAADELVTVLDTLNAEKASGGFYDYRGHEILW